MNIKQFSSPKETAQALTSAAISFVPVKIDGSKAASVEWKQYQERLPTPDEVRGWFGNGATRGIASICGDVSGGLEAIDLDFPEIRDRFESLIRENCPGLLERLLIVRTPKNGRHYIYRSTGVEKNQKLARRPVEADRADIVEVKEGANKWKTRDNQEVVWIDGKPFVIKVSLETRGEGGYVVAPGSPDRCHPLNKPYLLIQGDYGAIPQLSREERGQLFLCAREFNEYVEPVQEHREPRPPSPLGEKRPGEDFNARVDVAAVAEMLRSAGWTQLNRRSKMGTMWKRPGKTDPGGSATLCDNGALHIFSTNAYPFEDHKSYSPFAVLAMLEHGGDFGACAKFLASQGYGEQRKRIQIAPAPTENAKNSQVEPDPAPIFAPSDTLLRPRELSVMGLAAKFHEQYYKTTRYVEARAAFYNYCAGRWVASKCESEIKTKVVINQVHDEAKEVEDRIKRLQERHKEGDLEAGKQIAPAIEYHEALIKFLAKIKTPTTMNQILDFSRSDLLIQADDFDPDDSLLNVANGAVELGSGSFRNHRPEDLCSMVSPVSYDKDAKCERWLRFLDEIFLKNQELVDFTQRLIGYCISGETSEQVFLILHGDGSNGKTELLWVLGCLLGSYMRSANIDTFMDDKPVGGHNEDIARLRGARLVTTSETEKSKRLAEGLVKKLTGQEVITASFKHERTFEFTPKFTILLAANHKPVINGTDYGIWRRIVLIPFQAKFVKPGVELEGALPIDPNLRADLNKELPGILNWAIRGYAIWRAQGLALPEIVKVASAEYQEESDKLGAFLREEMLEGADFYSKLSDAYEAYRKWAEAGGMKASSIRGFSSDLKSRGVMVKKHGASNSMCVVGYGLFAN